MTFQVAIDTSEVKVGKKEGLPKTGVINCDWLITIPKTMLAKKAGSLSAVELDRLDDALRFALGVES